MTIFRSKHAFDIHYLSRQWNEAMAYVYGFPETNEEQKRQKGQAYCPWLGRNGETVQNTAIFLLVKLMSILQLKYLNPTIDRKRWEEHGDRMGEAKWLKTVRHYKITI